MKRIAFLAAVFTLAASSVCGACDGQLECWFSSVEVKDVVAAVKTAGKQAGALRQTSGKSAPEIGSFPFEEAQSLFIKLGERCQPPTTPFLLGDWILVGETHKSSREGSYNSQGLGASLKFVNGDDMFQGKYQGLVAVSSLLIWEGSAGVFFNHNSVSLRDATTGSWINYECRSKEGDQLLCYRVERDDCMDPSCGPDSISYLLFVKVK